jgi:fatty-acyl-CoA synthase
MPRDVWFTTDEALPKTGTGKVQKAELRKIALEMLAEQKAV